ncbi:MAG: glutamate--tRNA ligase, partial [Pseudomonadota bacterium]
LGALAPALDNLNGWDEASIEELLRAAAEKADLKLGKLAQPLRAALTGSTASPGLFEVMAVLGREETILRLQDAATSTDAALHQKD